MANVAVESLPRMWNAKYREYLGIEPAKRRRRRACKTSTGPRGFGYFPTYTLGNLYAAQIYATLRRELPGLRRAAGERRYRLRPQLAARAHVRLRRDLPPEDLIQRVTGARARPAVLRALPHLQVRGHLRSSAHNLNRDGYCTEKGYALACVYPFFVQYPSRL